MSGGADLLKLLASGVRPAGSPDAAARKPTPAVDGASFAELLRQADAGELSSHKRVTADPSSGITLTDEESLALSAAADKAEAKGVRNALVMVGDRAMIMDVGSRTITGPADLSSGVLQGVDGVIKISGSGSTVEGAPGGSQPGILPPPSVPPSSLAGLFTRD